MPLLRDLAYLLIGLLTSPVWLLRLAATGKWRTDWPGRFGIGPSLPDAGGRKTLLLHAVSVGEVNAIRQLVEGLSFEAGDRIRLVISTTTNTGFARAQQLFGGEHAVVRYPFDFSLAVGRFLRRIEPDAVALVELELWPNFVAACARRKTPVLVVNGRLSERSFGRYRRFGALLRPTFARVATAAVQDEDYAARFRAMGTPEARVRVTGNMKWDTAVIADSVDGSEGLANAMGIDADRPLVVCGSTGPGEEKMIAEALSGVDAQILMAPRKPERFSEAAVALGGPVRRTDCPDGTERPRGGERFFLLDTIGDLPKAYALADVVVVGRSFCPLYGSDMIEPVALGKPTVVGPNTGDFRDAMTRLLTGDGIRQVSGIGELAGAVGALLGSEQGASLAERGRAVIRQQQGATGRHVQLLIETLGD